MTHKRRLHKAFTLLAVICVFTSGWANSTHQPPLAAAPLTDQSIKTRQEISTFFKSYELLEIDSRRVAQQVRQSGRFRLVTSQGDLDLYLAPHDMRGHNYRATRVNADGVLLPLALDPVHTFKGVVADAPGSQVRFTIEEDRIEGLILKDGQHYHLESARRFSTSADSRYFVFYKTSDVIHDMADACGVSLSEQVNAASRHIEAQTQTSVSPFRVIELATEADYEYVSALGGPANAINDILSIMNQVEGVYETELGLTFQIVFQNVWETAADPYTAVTDDGILIEFADYWNTNFAHVGRDVTHMWSGKVGGRLGLAVGGVTCSFPTLSYSFSKIHDQVPYRYILPAHEIAHNIGASHADGHQECVGTIMNPLTTTSQLTFCQFSRSEIAQYVEQSGQCLGGAPVSIHSISGRVTDISGKPLGGVRMQVSGSSARTAQTDAGGGYLFNDLAHGGSYTITPSRENYAFIPQSLTFNELVDDQVANFTVKNSPDGPVLVTEESSNRAIALDSVTLLRGPFPVFTLHNFSPDKRMRVLLFAYNAALLPGEDVSAVKAQAEDALGNMYPLAVESVQTVPALSWLSQMTVKLPNELDNAGEVLVSISLRGAVSNRVLITITPSGGLAP